jgi:hypothetical protein
MPIGIPPQLDIAAAISGLELRVRGVRDALTDAAAFAAANPTSPLLMPDIVRLWLISYGKSLIQQEIATIGNNPVP